MGEFKSEAGVITSAFLQDYFFQFSVENELIIEQRRDRKKEVNGQLDKRKLDKIDMVLYE